MSLRVLFVDDEKRVLDGLARMLFSLDVDWTPDFALGGPEALAMLEQTPASVVVTDMRMPVMNGAELLRHVRERWPATLRVILSGHTAEDDALSALRVAHRFLSKPCEGPVLVETVERLRALEARLRGESMKRVVGRIGTLPPAPRVYAALGGAVDDPDISMAAVAAVLQQDPALVAKVLQIANSAFFRTSKPVHDIGTAVLRLGLATLRSLVLAGEVFGGDAAGPAGAEIQQRALLASRLARRMAPGFVDPGMASTAALLAPVGALIPGIDALCREAAADDEAPITPVEVGACLLGLWGLPTPIVEAVAHHRQPASATGHEFGAIGVVHVATALAAGEAPDPELIARHGMAERLREWNTWREQMEYRND